MDIKQANDQFSQTSKTVALDISKLPFLSENIYIFLFTRIKNNKGQYYDLVYGQDGSGTTPWQVDITSIYNDYMQQQSRIEPEQPN